MHPSTVVHEEKRGTPVAEVTSIRMREVEIELSELLTDEDVDGLDLPIIRPTQESSTSGEDERLLVSEDATPTPKTVPMKVYAPTPPAPSRQSAIRGPLRPVAHSMSQTDEPSLEELEAVKLDILTPKDVGREEVPTKQRTLADDTPQTSPLSLKLVSSDAAEPESPDSNQALREDSDEESDEVYETAQPDQQRSEEVFETAPEYSSQVCRGNENDEILEVAESEHEGDLDDGAVTTTALDVEESERGGEEKMKSFSKVRHEPSRIETQALFKTVPHEKIDPTDMFALPEPEGDWTTIEDDQADTGGLDEDIGGREEEGSDADESEEMSPSPSLVPRPNAVATAAPTLSPPPRRVHAHSLATKSPPPPAKTHPCPQSPKPQLQSTLQSQIMAYLSTQLSANPHTSELQLITAIQATCFAQPLIPRVYHSLSSGHGLPKNMKGCWTEEDDETLQKGMRGGVSMLEGKHGMNGVRRRSAWLFGDGDATQREETEGSSRARSTAKGKQTERERERPVPVVVIEDEDEEEDEDEGEFWRAAELRSSRPSAR